MSEQSVEKAAQQYGACGSPNCHLWLAAGYPCQAKPKRGHR